MHPLTDEQKRKFVDALRESCQVKVSAKAAGASRNAFYMLRRKDPRFRLEWDEAKDDAAEMLEDEAFRRAVVGVDKPVYHMGICVDTMKGYSDGLLTTLLKGARPHKYANRTELSTPAADKPPHQIKTEEDRVRLFELVKNGLDSAESSGIPMVSETDETA